MDAALTKIAETDELQKFLGASNNAWMSVKYDLTGQVYKTGRTATLDRVRWSAATNHQPHPISHTFAFYSHHGYLCRFRIYFARQWGYVKDNSPSIHLSGCRCFGIIGN